MQNIFSSTLPIFLITLLGSLIRKKWITSEEFWRNLEKLSYFLLFPALLFNYTANVDFSSSSIVRLACALVIATSIVAISLVLYQRKRNMNILLFTSVFQGAVRYNSYILFALSDKLFGPAGLSIASVISTCMIICTNIMSIIVFAHYVPENRQHNRSRQLIFTVKLLASNPLIIASIIGFLFNYLGFKLNGGVGNAVLALSESALAIGMLNVGAGLRFNITAAHYRPVMLASIVKLVIMPIVTILVLICMSINGIERSMGVLYSGLPCASTAYVLSRQLGADPESMASIITFSTMFSILSISLLMYLVG